MLLASSHQGDDFQPVAFGQPMPGMAMAGHQLEVGLDGHVLIGQAELLEQLGNRRSLGYPAKLIVDDDFHGCDPLLESIYGPADHRRVGVAIPPGAAAARNLVTANGTNSWGGMIRPVA